MRGRAGKPISQCPIGVPYGVLKFAPKKERRDGVPTEQCGGPIVEIAEKRRPAARVAKNRINQVETEIERVQDPELAKKDRGEAR